MTSVNLHELAQKHLTEAQESGNGRHSETIYGGREHDLRQTLICLTEGHGLSEHASPGEATVQVLVGAIDITAGGEVVRLAVGDYYLIPPLRHSVHAPTDAAFLLTVATRAT
ncbi:cupin domain-containing protein [Demequina aurantiaca]|uniref:cupin domain-containing protein n=1 Tax=Demequina aurantiaca TaxID=676200 RepID=UPI000785046C|nr:cupin domain-containing protein [Demequina aurantiaca]